MNEASAETTHSLVRRHHHLRSPAAGHRSAPLSPRHRRDLCAGTLYGGVEAIVNFSLPKFHIDVSGATEATASIALTFFWLGMAAGRLGFVPLVMRYSSARLLFFCSSTLATCLLASAFASTQTAALVLAFRAGLGASASYRLIASNSKHSPEGQSWAVSSLFILAGTTGSLVLPTLMGFLAEAAGFRVAFAMTALPAVTYGLLAFLVYARTERVPMIFPPPVPPGARLVE